MLKAYAKHPERFALVGDIGGTNARLALVKLNTNRLYDICVYPCAEFNSLEAILQHHIAEQNLQSIKYAGIAVACPVLSDSFSFTNLPWHSSAEQIRKSLGLEYVEVQNDFAAIAFSLSCLGGEDVYALGQGRIAADAPALVLGPGTGLGVAAVRQIQGRTQVIDSEAGHIEWSATNAQEWSIYQHFRRSYPRVSVERLLSGSGLEGIAEAIALHQDPSAAGREASTISQLATEGDCTLAREALEQFCAVLGSFAGDMALAFNAFGGVFIGGGIAPRIATFMQDSPFRQRFESKGRFRESNQSIATKIIMHPQPGLLGMAVCLAEGLGRLATENSHEYIE